MNDEFRTEETPPWYRPHDGEHTESSPAGLEWPEASPADAWPAPAVAPERDPIRSVAAQPASGNTGRGWNIREASGGGGASTPPADHAAPDLPGVPPVFMPWEAPPVRRSPTRRYILFGVALLALVGLAALFLTNATRTTHSISQPASVGALTQVDSPAVTAAMDQLQHYEQSAGATDVVTGVYGSAGQPQLLLLLVRSPLIPDSGGAANDPSFINGFAGGIAATGWSFDKSQATTTTVDGSTFECGPVSSSGLGMTLSTCAWVDAGVGGAVFDLSGQSVADTLNQAVQARHAGEH